MAIVVEGQELSALEWQALKVAGKEADQLRAGVEVGPQQEVDFTVRVRGSIDVSEPTESTSTSKPRPEDLLARVFDRLARGPLDDCAALHGFLRRLRGELGEPAEQSAEYARAIVESFTRRDRKPANGPVKGALTLIRL